MGADAHSHVGHGGATGPGSGVWRAARDSRVWRHTAQIRPARFMA